MSKKLSGTLALCAVSAIAAAATIPLEWNERFAASAPYEVVIDRSKLDKFADNLFRHVVVAGELNIGKNIVLRVGYNYGLRKSMISPTKKGAVGLSYGVGINVYKFTINYSRSEMHIHGSPNYITITTNLDSFKKH